LFGGRQKRRWFQRKIPGKTTTDLKYNCRRRGQERLLGKQKKGLHKVVILERWEAECLKRLPGRLGIGVVAPKALNEQKEGRHRKQTLHRKQVILIIGEEGRIRFENWGPNNRGGRTKCGG